MAVEVGYYRHPTLSGDTIAFACEDDLWSVPASGGVARRLTANPGKASFPVLSPDGEWIAFTSRDEGPSEVYVMAAGGGPPRRLTWFGTLTQVAGWRPDGQAVILATDWRQPFPGYYHLHWMDLEGGQPTMLKVGPARAISFEPGGKGVVIGRNSGDPARWKRYRGGTAGTLWIDRAGAGEFTQLMRLPGNLANPMWIGSRIYFLSDHEGFGNLYSCTATGRDLHRHTHHQDFYVRFPATDGERIVYQSGGDLHLFDPATDHPRKLDISTRSSQSQRNRKFVRPGRYLESIDVHPAGHSIAAVSRGGVYTMGLWEGASSRHGAAAGSRYRLAAWLPNGERIVTVSDEGGEEGLVVLTTGQDRGRKRTTGRISGDFGRAIELVAAPGRQDMVALSNQRQELWVVDIASGRSAMVERSPAGRIEGLAWSPDGRYLAYGFPETRRVSTIRICDVATGKIYPITRPEFRDMRPAFDPEGKYLYFISWRVLDPVYDSIFFDLGFPRGARPYLIPLRADIVSPFSASTRTPRAPGLPLDNGELDPERAAELQRRAARSAQADEARRTEPVQTGIDFEGIADRVVPLPVPDGRYGRVMGGRGRILFSVYPIEGSLHHDWAPQVEPDANGILQAYDFANERVEIISDHITDFTVSMTGKVIALRVGNRIRVLAVSARANGGRRDRSEISRETGWIDLDRLRVSVVPAEEWSQMFREAWRLQRDQFWTPDMSGVDWQAIHDRYLPLVERVASRAEFSDLLWEMQGELGTSHCYELGGDYRPEPGWMQAHLGADLTLDSAGHWRVGRIPFGDQWNEEASSPLSAPGLGIREGDEILAVGGEPVGRDVSPYERLVNLANQNVELTVRSRGKQARRPKGSKDGKGAPSAGAAGVRTVTIKTLGQEFSLRYRDWVAKNRELVHRATKGRVGYLHIPDMGPRGYSEFHRSYLSEVDRDGLVIDVRWNGGGHVSQLLLEKLLRRRVGYDMNRWGVPEPYPTDSPAGPMVAITNEYAGSDGDIFSHCFKLFGLGPLIGKRTWGGVVGIWPRHALVDGTVTTQPEFAFWFEDVGWGVENYGTDPDIQVEFRPQDHAAGDDPQLGRALVEIEKQLTRRPPRQPDFGRRPQLAPVALPPQARNGSRRLKAAALPAAVRRKSD